MVYSCIVADPPWKVSAGRTIGLYEKDSDGTQRFGVKDQSARKLEYPSMSLEEICSLVIPAADNCHLYLWTINAYLDAAFDVVKAWGFKYSTTLVWVKRPMGGGLGGSFGLATEYVLFARRGKLKALSRIGRNWWDWKRPYKGGYPNHSAKPPEFYELVECVSPGPRLEMFARAPRHGWSVWGNEIACDVEIAQRAGGEDEHG